MDRLLVTWRDIAGYCGIGVSTARKLKGRLIEDNVIFWRSRRGGKRVVCAYTEDLKKFQKKMNRSLL
jgi:hypothetical protein